MSPTSKPRIFISYARSDGLEMARMLRERLQSHNLAIWQDLTDLEAGTDWWTQIAEAIKSPHLEHLVLLVTPAALERPVIRMERRLARQEGKQVWPVKGPGLDLKAPRWIGHVVDIDFPEQWQRLVRGLEGPSQQRRVPKMVPDPPAHFVKRPEEYGRLRAALLDTRGDAVAITAALRGAGGYGKTVLANYLCHDPDIQDEYFDGILRVELGESPETLRIISDLLQDITGEARIFSTLGSARAKLAEALGDLRYLLVVDDVWRSEDLAPFLDGGPKTTRLITTRNDSVLPRNAVRVAVDAMRMEEGLDLIAHGLEANVSERVGLQALATRLGEWPLLLALVNGFLCNRTRAGEPLRRAIEAVDKRLEVKGLTAFDARDENQRNSAVARTLGVSLDLLSESERLRFHELCVFPEEAEVPLGLLEVYWQANTIDTEEVAHKFWQLSLLFAYDLGQRMLRIHDVIRAYLRREVGPDNIKKLNQKLIAAIDARPEGYDTQTDRHYAFQHLPRHLDEAGQRDRIKKLLVDPRWLQGKLEAVGAQSVIADYQYYASTPAHNLMHRTFGLVANGLARDHRQMPAQLVGRLKEDMAEECPSILGRARALIEAPALVPSLPTLTAPGAELQRIDIRGSGLLSVIKLDSHRVICSARDHSVRLWDIEAEREIRRLAGHTGIIKGLAVLDSRRVLSASADGTVRLWDVETGEELARFSGHTRAVNGVAVLDGRRFASVGDDRTLRVWDIDSRAEVLRLSAGRQPVFTLVVLNMWHIVTSGGGHILRLWDIESGAEIGRLEGHKGKVNALAKLEGDLIASASDDGTVRVWNTSSFGEMRYLRGHSATVHAVAKLRDGRIVSGSADRSIRVWDFRSGNELTRLEGHLGIIHSVAALDDRHIVSASEDGTMRVWDADSTVNIPRAQAKLRSICTVSALTQRLVVAASREATAELWDARTGTATGLSSGHPGGVYSVAALSAERVICGLSKGSIRAWNVSAFNRNTLFRRRGLGVHSLSPWAPEANFRQDESAVTALLALDGQRFVSGHKNGMLRLWDMRRGFQAAIEEEQAGAVVGIARLDDKRVVAGWSGGPIVVWEIGPGSIGGRYPVATVLRQSAVAVLDINRIASASGGGDLRILRIDTREEIARWPSESGEITGLVSFSTERVAGQYLVYSSQDGRLSLFDVNRRETIASLDGDGAFTALCVEPGGHRVVVGDALGRIHWVEVRLEPPV